MNDTGNIYQKIDAITLDNSLSVSDRIQRVLDLVSEETERIESNYEDRDIPEEDRDLSEDDERQSEVDTRISGIELYMADSLISLIRGGENPSEYADVLVGLYACKADIFAEFNDYRKLKGIAEDTLDLMRHQELTWEQMEEPVAEIIDSLDASVYRHLLLEMLILYLDAANREGCLNDELKGRARKMLKLNMLLNGDCWCSHIIKKELFSPISKLFTSEELLKIMLYPELRSIKSDPVEYTREWEEIYYDVEEELDRRFANAPKVHGFCFIYWRAKKELLKDKYGIEWRSPSQMNPRVKFD